ncbi:MAG: glycosyltransferase family 9 protein [Acidobacteria bacterium]|nr:glycosyltransferase family 9 protein [Acidobacteriota bacterium]
MRSLGDCILMTPALRLLKEHYPHLRLSVLVERPFRDVFSAHPLLDELLVLDRGRTRVGTYCHRLAMARRLRRAHYDLVLNYHGGSTSLLLMTASGARYRAGYARFRSPRRYTHLVESPETFFGGRPLHTAEYQAALLFALGVPVPDRIPPLEMHIRPDIRSQVRNRLTGEGYSPGEFILVHPTATQETKRWPEDQFARIIEMIQREFERPVLMTCGPGEEEIPAGINAGLPSPVRFLSRLTVMELAAVIEAAHLFIGCDSGPAHLAAALGKKSCVIFGSSNARAWHPWQTEYRLVQLAFPCNPCPGYRCEVFGRPRCILEIEPDMVFDAVRELIS